MGTQSKRVRTNTVIGPLLLAAALMMGCPTDPVPLPPSGCVPGAQAACACPGGASSVQVCASDRTFGSCQCGDAATVVDVAPVDAPDAGEPPLDTGALDTGALDTGAPDTGALDTGTTDTAPLDTGATELDVPVLDTPAVDVSTTELATLDSGSPVDLDSAPMDVLPDGCASATVGNCCGVSCAAPPHATPACLAGACGVGSCVDNYADCDGDPSNGCECRPPNATGACAARACAVRECASGYGDCDHLAGNGCESVLASDAANCGACGAPCAAGRACIAGACVLCASGQTPCAGACADTQTSTAHCGACGHACASGQVCTGGACITPCSIGHLSRCTRGAAAPACCANGETCETTYYSMVNPLCCVLAQSACSSVADCCYGVPCSDGRCCVRPGGWSPNDETCCSRTRVGTTCR